MTECEDCKKEIVVNNRGRKRKRCKDCQKQRTKEQIRNNTRRYYAQKKQQATTVVSNG